MQWGGTSGEDGMGAWEEGQSDGEDWWLMIRLPPLLATSFFSSPRSSYLLVTGGGAQTAADGGETLSMATRHVGPPPSVHVMWPQYSSLRIVVVSGGKQVCADYSSESQSIFQPQSDEVSNAHAASVAKQQISLTWGVGGIAQTSTPHGKKVIPEYFSWNDVRRSQVLSVFSEAAPWVVRSESERQVPAATRSVPHCWHRCGCEENLQKAILISTAMMTLLAKNEQLAKQKTTNTPL